LIPESLESASDLDCETFALIRRHLPNDVYVWHASAMELADDESIPFLLMSEDAGIAALFPLNGSLKPSEAEKEIASQKAQFNTFKALLEGSELPALVDGQGTLKPALHHVCITKKLSGKQISAAGLRNLDAGIVMLGEDELGQLINILTSATAPAQRINNDSFNAVRACISPSLEIPFISKRQRRADKALDEAGWQPILLDVHQELAVKSFADIPDEQLGTVRDLDARMIRGVAGSGKTLVLLHRAQYLAQHNPDWKILVLTYNRALADFLNARHREMQNPCSNITIQNFHSWCRAELYNHDLWLEPANDSSLRGMLKNVLAKQGIDLEWDELNYYIDEFDWIREMDIRTLDAYLNVERRGRLRRFDAAQRRLAWKYYEQYVSQMRQDKTRDWVQVAVDTLAEIENGRIPKAQYHAILVDEAQDFPTLWFKIIQMQLRPATNSLFIVADVAQKIYRRPVSWRALGIDINSRRIRILKKSYRNTYEILKAANDVVADTSVVNDLRGEGEEIVAPELNAKTMRNGTVPFLLKVRDQYDQARTITGEITRLHDAGYAWGDIAIFLRKNVYKPDEDPLIQSLRRAGIDVQITRGRDVNMASDQVKLVTLHASKGLEFSVVFVADVDHVQAQAGLDAEGLERQIAEERRLLYVGMTRARERLYLLHTAPLPVWLNASLVSVDRTTTLH
jgi:hypothetical protein